MKPSTVLVIDAETRRAEPFPPGNDIAVKHGFYATLREEDERAIEAAADGLRSAVQALDAWADGFEPLVQIAAGRIVLRERAYAELLRVGPAAAPGLFKNLTTFEARVDSSLAALGLGPASFSEIVERMRGAGDGDGSSFDKSKLTPSEFTELRRLVEKGST